MKSDTEIRDEVLKEIHQYHRDFEAWKTRPFGKSLTKAISLAIKLAREDCQKSHSNTLHIMSQFEDSAYNKGFEAGKEEGRNETEKDLKDAWDRRYNAGYRAALDAVEKKGEVLFFAGTNGKRLFIIDFEDTNGKRLFIIDFEEFARLRRG